MPLSEAVKAQLRAAKKTEAEIAAIEAAGDVGSTGPKAPTPKKASTTRYPSIYSDTRANAAISDFFRKTFRREPTADDLNKWRPLLIQAQKQNPSVQKYDPKTKTQTTTGGIDVDQWLLENVTSDPVYSAELNKLSTISSDVLQREKDKKSYLEAIKAAGKDQAKIDELNRGTPYGLAIAGLKSRIKLSADRAGATVDEATLEALAQEAYDTNQDSDAYTFQNFLNNKLKFGFAGMTGLKGEAANNVSELNKVAIANGIDLQKAFGSQLPAWLEAINKGANIDDFKKTIRDVAKIGMPEKIAKLIDQGIDLQTIYSPYANMMENILELPSGSVGLDDPTLRAAVTAEGEIPLYQFERNLRQDKRWQFTNSAREEISGAVNKVLRDFGFQG